MSKAFTRESDDAGEDPLPAFRAELPPGTRNYITREGADRLKRRLEQLLEAKQNGAAQQSTEAMIKRLQQVLESVVVAQPPADQERIAFGATVSVRYPDGEEETYRIVGVEEADPEQGSISWLSPLARALLTHKAGEKVRFRTPGGEQELSITSVSY